MSAIMGHLFTYYLYRYIQYAYVNNVLMVVMLSMLYTYSITYYGSSYGPPRQVCKQIGGGGGKLVQVSASLWEEGSSWSCCTYLMMYMVAVELSPICYVLPW